MAERKPRQVILKRDEGFTQKIEKRQHLQNAFKVRSADPAPATENFVQPDAVQKDVPASQKGVEATEISAPQPKPGPVKPRTRMPKASTRSEGRAMEPLRVCFTVPLDLSERAEKAGMQARCDARQIVLLALKEIKPQLLEGLRNLKHSDVNKARTENAGIRITTTWHIKPDLMAALGAELDPANIGQTSSLVGFWVREKLLAFFPEYLSRFGA